ncbi:MAG: hypothetical protein ACRC2T_04155, partial [Thermoguttaceae bacterium]
MKTVYYFLFLAVFLLKCEVTLYAQSAIYVAAPSGTSNKKNTAKIDPIPEFSAPNYSKIKSKGCDPRIQTLLEGMRTALNQDEVIKELNDKDNSQGADIDSISALFYRIGKYVMLLQEAGLDDDAKKITDD